MDELVLTWAAQFGVAGLIAWMWLAERRSSATRERQLSELHERVMSDRTTTEVLISVISANTRAMTSLESAHRELASAIERGSTTGGAGRAA